MIPNNYGNQLYAGIFVFLILVWPLSFAEGTKPHLMWPFLITNTSLFILVWYFNSHPEMSYFRGLSVICASMMTGCLQMTIMILPWVLAFVSLTSLFFTLVGLIKGRKFTQERWMKLVLAFYNRGQINS